MRVVRKFTIKVNHHKFVYRQRCEYSLCAQEGYSQLEHEDHHVMLPMREQHTIGHGRKLDLASTHQLE